MIISKSRRAMALPATLLLVFIGLAIAVTIKQYSSETYRRTSRGTYATMSEVLAESAAEEAWYTLQRDVNTPGTELYGLFRKATGFADFTVQLPTLRSKLNDPQFGGYLSERFSPSACQATVSMNWENPYGNKMPGVTGAGEFDAQVPYERVGVITIRASVQASARAEGLANFRRMVVKRPFRLLKITPPAPFDRSPLVILYPEHVTDVAVAGVLDEATAYAAANGGKSKLMPMLDRANNFVETARTKSKEFNDLYKGAVAPPFGGHMVDPPKWLQGLIDKLGGLVSKASRLDLQGEGRRPFLFNDEVMVARATVPGGALGKLSEFNYGRNIREKLGPLNDLMDGLQKVSNINNDILKVLSPIHRSVPYGAPLQAMVTPLYAIVPELVGTVKDICEGLHEKLLDPVIEILVGMGQVLALVQKIVIEVPMMGQQAFAGFANQISGAAADKIDVGAITGPLNINSDALMGLPTNTPAMAFGLDMPLPNYSTGDEQGLAGSDAGSIVREAGEGLLGLIQAMVVKEVTAFIAEQMTALAAKITVATTVTAAACAGPQAIFTCVPAKAALALAFEVISKTVMREITQKLNRIGGFKGDAMNKVVGALTSKVPALNGNPLLKELNLAGLLGSVMQAAWEKEDVSPAVEAWLQNLLTKMGEKTTEAVSKGTGIDKLGGVLKGYVLRHRFRNLVEFDGSGSMSAGSGGSSGLFAAVGGVPSDGLNIYRNTFDRVYKEKLWAQKATWKITKRDHWDALLSRYFEGVYLVGKDPSGDGTSVWRADSYAPNAGYGLNGVVYYTSTEDLTIDFTGAREFIGKCILYVPNAKVNVVGCKMRDLNRDTFTLICAKPVTLPPTDVEISVHAIGNSGEDCQVRMSESTKILGSVVLKRYTSANESNDVTSLKGELTFNKHLDAQDDEAFDRVKNSHLFVTVSPYTISRDMETTP